MTDDALLHSPMRDQARWPSPDPQDQCATDHYGRGYSDPTRHFGNAMSGHPDSPYGRYCEEDLHYHQLRREHERQLDDDYQGWRLHRFSSDFQPWRDARREPLAPSREGPLQSFGRAIGETVTGTQPPDLDEDRDRPEPRDRPSEEEVRATTDRFFERA
ncbi:MAG TPA: hypothetical protein VFP68_24100 [Burkholderiaceae bacterium]|nr:hypothetical protein [Burkholderiaceae bacterium]